MAESAAAESAAANTAADHLRDDENGTVPVTGQGGASGWASATARRVALGSGSDAAIAASSRSSATSPTPSSPTVSDTTTRPVVIVPVLSRHNVSTRASSSTEASSRSNA